MIFRNAWQQSSVTIAHGYSTDSGLGPDGAGACRCSRAGDRKGQSAEQRKLEESITLDEPHALWRKNV